MSATSATACQACAARVPIFAWVGNFSLTIFKLVVGFLGGSPALMADGLHSFTDVIGTSVILASTRISGRAPSREFPYGQGKIEFLSAMFIYVVLIALAIFIFVGGLLLLLDGHEEPPHLITVLGGGVSILYNVLMFRLGQCAGVRTNSPALLANSFENRADAISSITVCVGIVLAILIHPAADPLAAMLVGVIIFVNCIHEGHKALQGLMDNRALSPAVHARIRAVAAAHDGVTRVRFIKTRPTGTGYWLDLGIEVAPTTVVEQAEAIAARVEHALRRRSMRFSGVEVYVLPGTADG
jgi:cation diffusion facilitator family transporter